MLAALIITHMSSEATSERIGLQSSPPPAGDWVITTKGNVIIDETFMEETTIPEEGEPSSSPKDDSVHVYGNLIIESGGELTLINASLTFDDQAGDGFYIEVGGSLIMNASGEMWDRTEGTSMILTVSNNSALRVKTDADMEPDAPLLKNMNITGTVLMGEIACAINHMNPDTSYMNIDSGHFNGTSMIGFSELFVSDSYVNITGSHISSQSTDEDHAVISIMDSTVSLKQVGASSNGSVGVRVERSDLTIESGYFSGSLESNTSKGLYAEDSWVNITGSVFTELKDYALKTRGDTELLVDGTIFGGLNRDMPDDGRFALDLGGRLDTIQNGEFRSRCSAPIIGAQSELFRLSGTEIHNATGTTVVYHGTHRAELEGNVFYDLEGTAVVLRNAAEVSVTNNNFSYERKWDSKIGGYVVLNILEKGLVVEGVENFTIQNNLFLKTGGAALEIIDSPEGFISDNTFAGIGHEAEEKLHCIIIDSSFAGIEDNIFNGSSLRHGFEILAVGYGWDGGDLVMDGLELVADNVFNDTITNRFAQAWELDVRTRDPAGNPVKQVTINLSSEEHSDVFYTDNNGDLGPVHVYEYTVTGESDLTNYDLYSIDANITRNNISFSASGQLVPDHHQEILLTINPLRLGKGLSIVDPPSGDVLNSFTVTLSFHVFNEGTGTISQDFAVAYRPSGEEDWIAIGELTRPIINGDLDIQYTWTDILEAGSYDIMVSLSDNVSVQESETLAMKLGALEVFTRPSVSFDLQEEDMISGTAFAITGMAMDPMANKITRVEMVIEHEGVNGTKLFPDFTLAGDHWEWTYTMDTTTSLNGRYRFWVMAINEAANGDFARSSWESLTVIINNEPRLVLTGTNPDITKPGQEVVSKIMGDTINVQGTIEGLYNNTHIFKRIDVSIDGGALREVEMKLNIYPTTSTWTYSWTDYLAFSDGPHELVFTGHYNNSKELVALEPVSIIIKIDSDRPETDPALIINNEKPMDEDGNFLISGNASDDWQLTLLQYKQGAGGEWKDLMVLEEGTTAIDWSINLDYKTLLVGPNYIYVKASDGFEDNETFTILLFIYRYDLEVLNITMPTQASTRQNFTVTTTIENKGPHDTPPGVALHFYIGSIQKEEFITIEAGETKDFTFSFSMAEAGTFTGKVMANPGMKTDETNDTNNEMEAASQITIIAPSTDEGDTTDDEGIFEGNTLLIVVGVLVILFIATAAAYYSFSSRKPSAPSEPLRIRKIDETLSDGWAEKEDEGDSYHLSSLSDSSSPDTDSSDSQSPFDEEEE